MCKVSGRETQRSKTLPLATGPPLSLLGKEKASFDCETESISHRATFLRETTTIYGYPLLQREGLSHCQTLGSFHRAACLASVGPGDWELLTSDLFVWDCASSTLDFPPTWPQKVKTNPLLSPNSFSVSPASSPPAPNHYSFLPQVYRPRKQPLNSIIPCTCDADYSPDITAKYHGSSYNACMIQRSQVSQQLRRHSPPP